MDDRTRVVVKCLLVVVPLWLFAVAVVGYAKDRACTSDAIWDASVERRPRPTPAEFARCLGPSWSSPLHGLGWPPGSTEVGWTVVTAGAAGLFVLLRRRATARLAS